MLNQNAFNFESLVEDCHDIFKVCRAIHELLQQGCTLQFLFGCLATFIASSNKPTVFFDMFYPASQKVMSISNAFAFVDALFSKPINITAFRKYCESQLIHSPNNESLKDEKLSF